MIRTTRYATLFAAACLSLAATNALAADHAVTISGFAFQPANLTVASGDTITFTNNDAAPHTGTALDGSFDTGRLNQGQSATVTVTATTGFKCNFHPAMTGNVTVQ